ncbi:MAG: hypothetical protein CFE27_08640 [Alphaproteobacteria bacterium PA1]|nr:MAG: hypothetical protein CFE27_08640 [Alphaproteobacteria bacterium PA1]
MAGKATFWGEKLLRNFLCYGVSALALLAISTPVFAQTPPKAQDDPNQVEEIIVTAQRRSERLQNVPLAVSAVSGDQLAKLGINNPTELRFVSPSVNFGNSANTRGEGLAVRGVGTQIFGDGVEQSVGVVVDGVPMGRNGMGIADMLDVDRVEVLRGPQGMLFGKNASAGVISIITRAPRLGETSLDVQGSYATKDEIKASMTANIALGEQAALRVTYGTTERDGYIFNKVRNEYLNNRDSDTLRVRFLADVSETVRVQLSADWGNSNSLCCSWTARSAPATTPFGALNGASGIVPSPTNLTNAAGATFFQNQDYRGLTSQVDWNLGWAELTAIAGYRYWFAIDNNDPDILPINILDRNTGDSKVDQTSFEVRLASPAGQNFEWTLGLFSFEMLNTGGNIQAGTLGLNLGPGGTVGSDRRSTTINKSDAIFGQAAYTLFDKLKLIAGARYTDETLSVDWTQVQASNTIGTFPGRFYGSASASRGETNLSWRLTAQYNVTDDILTYVGVSRGYKGPAYDQGLVNSTVVFADPEIPTSYEAGFRSKLFNKTTIFNAVLFSTEFKDFQAQVFDQNVFPSRFTVANAGKIETKGAEVEFVSRPMTGLTLSGNAAWIDATYADFKNVACYLGQAQLPFGTTRTSPRQCIRINSATGPFVTEGTGNKLTNSPELTWNVSANYEQPISTALKGFAQINYFWRDDVSFSAAGDPSAVQEAYGLLGAQLGVASADGKWRVALFGKNLGDEKFVNNVIGQPVLGATGVYSQFPSPDAEQIVGISFEMSFGN